MNDMMEDLAITSHGRLVCAIAEAIEQGRTKEALEGLLCWVEAMSRHERNEIKSKLTQTGIHAYKLFLQPHNQARRHWMGEIETFRNDITELTEGSARLKNLLPDMMEDVVKTAKRLVWYRLDMEVPYRDPLPRLTLQDLLERDFLHDAAWSIEEAKP